MVKQHLHLNSVEVYTGTRLVFLQDLCSKCPLPRSVKYQRGFLLLCFLTSLIVQDKILIFLSQGSSLLITWKRRNWVLEAIA